MPKRRGPKGITNEKIKEALQATGGFVSHAAVLLKTSHQNVSKRVNSSPELKKFCEKLKDFNLDTCEFQLLKLIRQGHFPAIKFYLQCQGKERGYIQLFRNEVSGPAGEPIKIEKIERVIVRPDSPEVKAMDANRDHTTDRNARVGRPVNS